MAARRSPHRGPGADPRLQALVEKDERTVERRERRSYAEIVAIRNEHAPVDDLPSQRPGRIAQPVLAAIEAARAAAGDDQLPVAVLYRGGDLIVIPLPVARRLEPWQPDESKAGRRTSKSKAARKLEDKALRRQAEYAAMAYSASVSEEVE